MKLSLISKKLFGLNLSTLSFLEKNTVRVLFQDFLGNWGDKIAHDCFKGGQTVSPLAVLLPSACVKLANMDFK